MPPTTSMMADQSGDVLLASELAASCRKVLERPSAPETHAQLASVYHQRGEYVREVACLRVTANLDPSNEQWLDRLAPRLEQLEHFREAWALMARYGRRKQPPTLPEWNGDSLSNQHILIRKRIRELGAEIRNASMLPEMISKAQRCTVVCDTRLLPLFRRSFPRADFVRATEATEVTRVADVEASYETVAYWIRPDRASFPRQSGFLRADPELTNSCGERFRRRDSGLTVGISWKSTNADKRVPPLEAWCPLLRLPNFRFVCLQYGDCEADLAAFKKGCGVEVWSDPAIDAVRNLEEFAAQVASVDLVISISNSTAHLAGALGKPTWLLLDYVPLLIWPIGRRDTPWYPTMRIHWLERESSWQPFMDTIALKLSELALDPSVLHRSPSTINEDHPYD